MKRLAAIASLAAVSGSVAAQSSTTVFGIVDSAFTRSVGSVSNLNALTSGGNSSTRIGFRGTEDLGGGLSAGFWLESGFTVDNGAGQASNTNNQPSGAGVAGSMSFNRRATVSLVGQFGELRLGRDYAATTVNRLTYDAFGNVGIGASQAFAGMLGGSLLYRVSNSVMYFLPSNSTGLYGEAQVYLGENSRSAGPTRNDGTGESLRFGWRSGPFDIAATQSRTKFARTATTGDISSATLGARYDLGNVSFLGGYYRDEIATLAGLTGRGGQVAGLYRLGLEEFRLQYSSYRTTAPGNPEARKITLGFVHSFSKRTVFYSTAARIDNSHGSAAAITGAVTAPNRASSGFELGMRHAF